MIKTLLTETGALNELEKQYWLDLLPTMNARQMKELKEILESEKKSSDEAEKRESADLEKAGQKFLSRWDSEKARLKREKRVQEEKEQEKETEEKAEKLLKENW